METEAGTSTKVLDEGQANDDGEKEIILKVNLSFKVLFISFSGKPVLLIQLQKSVQDAILEIEAQLNNKAQLRRRIATAVQNRPEESYFSRLDSSIKKNTAFVRKLKNFTEAQKESILKDIQALNLTKYISEVASAVSKHPVMLIKSIFIY